MIKALFQEYSAIFYAKNEYLVQRRIAVIFLPNLINQDELISFSF